MSYHTGTINSATPALTAMGILDAALVAHPAWDFVEEVVAGAATARVYKNLALVSGLPNDFFVVISRDTDAGQMRFSICETWDAVGKLLVRYAPAASTTAGAGSYQVINADGSIGATGQAFTSPNVLLGQPTDPMLVSTAFQYYLSISNHRICYAHRNQGWVYAGAYESLPNYYDPYPLVLLVQGIAPYMQGYHINGGDTTFKWMRHGGYSNTSVGGIAATVSAALDYWCGSFTRQWRTTTQAATGWSVRMFLISQIVPTRGSGGLAYWNTREPLSGRFYPGRVGLNQAHASLGEGWDVRGMLRDVFQQDPMDNYPANGDSMVIEGVDHVCMCRFPNTQPGEHFWVSKAA